MKYLLDTHVLLWFLIDERKKLSEHAIKILNDESIYLHFSVASIWEIAIKKSLGKPNFQYNPKQIAGELIKLGFIELPIGINHVCAIGGLPNIHSDPFDRLLLVQSKLNQLTLMTADKYILQYEQDNVMNVGR